MSKTKMNPNVRAVVEYLLGLGYTPKQPSEPVKAPTYTPPVPHQHEHQPVKCGNWEVYASKHKWGAKPAYVPPVDLFIPLYNGWLDDITDLISMGVPSVGTPKVPFVYLPWPDQSAPDEKLFTQVLKLARSYVESGKKVEVACMGGHGRTGTFLACLIGEVEHLKGRAAVEAVRNRYCKDAIESQSQLRFIYWWLYDDEKQADVDFPPPVYTPPYQAQGGSQADKEYNWWLHGFM